MRFTSVDDGVNKKALVLVLYFLSMPLAEVYCLATGSAFLNFGSRGFRGLYIYGLAAPAVGYLLLTRHDRARFAAYVFLTIDIYRGVRIWSLGAIVANLFFVLYMQTSSMRTVYPVVKSEDVKARMRRRKEAVMRFIGLEKEVDRAPERGGH